MCCKAEGEGVFVSENETTVVDSQLAQFCLLDSFLEQPGGEAGVKECLYTAHQKVSIKVTGVSLSVPLIQSFKKIHKVRRQERNGIANENLCKIQLRFRSVNFARTLGFFQS